MKPDKRFVTQPKRFWACVRTLSQELGYTNRGKQTIKVPTVTDIAGGFAALSLNVHQIMDGQSKPTELASNLHDYFRYRASVLEDFVEPRLMTKETVPAEFNRLKAEYQPKCPLPFNKQKGEKKQHAFLTGIVNMLIERNIGESPCCYDPRILTTVTKDGIPVRTLSRRVDGAFPSVINPIAIWEVKEYYYTTTFGSRVADGVYETLLDGMELEELREKEQIDVKHYLMLDDRFTWWDCGRSYLCRIIDMLHMGYVDEVLFGREVIERLPAIAEEWAEQYRIRGQPEKTS